MRNMFLAAAACAAFSVAAPAAAQRTAADDVKVNQLIVYGNDPCPQSTDEEITVCGRLPESERYRIPRSFRNVTDPANTSWANKALELQYVGRTGIGSCSPVGPGGATGCLQQLINQARAERGGGEIIDWNGMIEKARQERLGQIDERSEEIEREQAQPR